MFSKYANAETVSVFVIACDVFTASDLLSSLNQRIQRIGLPHRVNALHECENSFKSCTGIDAWLRKWCPCSVGSLVVLHEHQVPKLHEAIAVRIILRTTIWSERRSAVIVNFRARTTRTCVPRLPEIVLVTQTLNAFHRNADLLVPDLLGFVI